MDVNLHSSLTQVMPIESQADVAYATRAAQRLAEQVGFDDVDASRVVLIINELADDILMCSNRGELHVRPLPGPTPGFEIVALFSPQASDQPAPILDDPAACIQSPLMDSIQHHADIFDVHSDRCGVVILTRFYSRSTLAEDVRFGISQHSLRDDPACGDVWEIAIQGKQVSMLVIDGLGHGTDAEIAGMAGARAFNRYPFAEPLLLLEEIHGDMHGTRGGVLAIAQYDGVKDRLRFIGIGDIGAVVIGQELLRGLASYPGIVGHRYRKGVVAELDRCAGHLLILYSDGLKSSWNLHDHPGLIYRHPAVIAAVLNRDYSRGTDDVTVMVMALE